MKITRGLCVFAAALFLSVSGPALAQGNGHGHGHGHGNEGDQGWQGEGDQGQHGRGHGGYGQFYGEHDRYEMRHWYRENYGNLPPGLARRDQLPPGLERQLMVRGTLPPGLRRRIEPCPEGLLRELPPPPPNCEHVLIGGHVVLMNRSTYMVLDIFHFERD